MRFDAPTSVERSKYANHGKDSLMTEEIAEVLISEITGFEYGYAKLSDFDPILVHSIEENGVQKPIGLKKKDKGFVSGRKRLTICKLLGRETIPARLLDSANPLRLELYAIDDNLVEPKLTVWQEAKLLARRKAVFEQLYPNTRKGKAGGLASAKAKMGEASASEQLSFAKTVAKMKGQNKRTVETLVQIANKIGPEPEALFLSTKFEDSKKDLLELSKLKPEIQVKVMQRLMGCDDKDENLIKHFMKPKNVTKAYLQVKREEYIKKSGAIPLEGKHYLLMEGDFIEKAQSIAPNSIDAIIVDPPYDKDSLKIVHAICELALVVLKPSGNLLMMVGQAHLQEFYVMMSQYEEAGLKYRWHCTLAWPRGKAATVRERKIIAKTKPVIWYVKGKIEGPNVTDLVIGNGSDKRFHDWGQAAEDFETFIERATNVGDVILDPCMGGCATGVAALRKNRKFIGIDKEPSCVKLARAHIYEALQREPEFFRPPEAVPEGQNPLSPLPLIHPPLPPNTLDSVPEGA